jgi:uncharacterized phage protein gp47/JayE
MPYPRPTLTALRQQVQQNINASLPGADALLRFSNLGVLAAVQAGLAHQHYGYLDWIAQQATPYTATAEYLAAWGALKSVYQKPASQASGLVTFPATGSPTIPVGAVVNRSDGTGYTVTALTSSTAGSITVTVLANADATGLTGAFGNSSAGTSFTLGQAIAGVTSTGTSGVISGGADLETEAAFRSRVVQAYQLPVQGGAIYDYQQWALQVPGVTRAWCVPLINGAGTVGVYVMLDNANVISNGLPQGANGVAAAEGRAAPATGDQLAVANYIYPLRPVTALVYVLAPTLTPVNFTLQGVPTSDQAKVTAALSSLLLSTSQIGWVVDRKDLWAAISSATTADFHIPVPSGDINLASGALPVLGTITWV